MHVLSRAHGFFARKSRQLKMEKYLHRVKPGRPELIVKVAKFDNSPNLLEKCIRLMSKAAQTSRKGP